MARRLAVVDDDEGIRAFVVAVAETCGYETITASNAQELIAQARSWQPTVVLLDLHMPQGDGIEALRELAHMGSDAKVLLTTGFDDRVAEVALRLGRERGLDMVGVLTKPMRVEALRTKLNGLHGADRGVRQSDLQTAIQEHELVLHYQPRFDVASCSIDGVEALVRWQHPKLGLLPPNEFIPLAEKTGLIDALTDSVVEMAVQQSRDWGRDGLKLAVAVNLSPLNLGDYTVPDRLERLCRSAGVDPATVIVEVTESAIMRDPLCAADICARLRLKGFQLAIDDFGTGYSSLTQLQRLPFSELKIDKSFVGAMLDSDGSAIIVDTIIGMAHNLHMTAVAEGVETRQVLDALTAKGCGHCQGYYISKPVPAAVLPTVLAAPLTIM